MGRCCTDLQSQRTAHNLNHRALPAPPQGVFLVVSFSCRPAPSWCGCMAWHRAVCNTHLASACPFHPACIYCTPPLEDPEQRQLCRRQPVGLVRPVAACEKEKERQGGRVALWAQLRW